MSRGDVRRALIADSAIAVLAAGGARALTHKAVDARAGLSAGSASYHFRTRKALITAAVERIRVLSREAFDAAARGAGAAAAVPPASTSAATPPASAADEAAALAADQLLRLAGERREQALAVFALLPEAAEDCELRSALLRCLFSRELAEDLMARAGQRGARGRRRALRRPPHRHAGPPSLRPGCGVSCAVAGRGAARWSGDGGDGGVGGESGDEDEGRRGGGRGEGGSEGARGGGGGRGEGEGGRGGGGRECLDRESVGAGCAGARLGATRGASRDRERPRSLPGRVPLLRAPPSGRVPLLRVSPPRTAFPS
jgi:DNA-binding transcriptional regulator YbjK